MQIRFYVADVVLKHAGFGSQDIPFIHVVIALDESNTFVSITLCARDVLNFKFIATPLGPVIAWLKKGAHWISSVHHRCFRHLSYKCLFL